MNVFENPAILAAEIPHITLAAGFFDGMHTGHRQIIDATRALATQTGSQAWVLTFEPHPVAVLNPAQKPTLLTTLEMRLEYLEKAGVAGCLLMPFTHELAALSPDEFVRNILGGWFIGGRSCRIVSGNNWRFGHARQGKISDIPAISNGLVETLEVPLAQFGGAPVSSSRIRAEIASGNIETANAMLGHPYAIRERTVYGRGVGTQMGMATANLRPVAELLPPVGVYEVEVLIFDEDAATTHAYKAVANLGFRPTFPDARPDRPEIEIHILGFSGDLHNHVIETRFVRRLRDEKKFATADALIAQINDDIRRVTENR